MSFRRLSHAFTVSCNDPAVADHVARVLARSRVREANDGSTAYEVLDLGPSEPQSRFRLLIDGRWVLGSGNPAHVLNDLFSHVNLHTVETTRNLVLVHAGAVTTPDAVGIVLPAPSGSGKTTLVAGLVRAGFGYLSDEAAVLDPATGMLHPYPVHLSLKAGSRDRFPEARPDPFDVSFSGDTWHVDPESIRRGAVASACYVGFVIAHRYEPGADARLESLTPAEACIELGRNLLLGRRDAARSLALLARVCRGSRSYRLTHGDLDRAVEAIAQLVGGRGLGYRPAADRTSPGTLSAPIVSPEAARPSASTR